MIRRLCVSNHLACVERLHATRRTFSTNSKTRRRISTSNKSSTNNNKPRTPKSTQTIGKRILSSSSVASGPGSTGSSTSLKSIVQDPRVRQALPWIGNSAYFAIASGFLMTDMLTLRMALVGGYTGLVAFHTLHAKPLLIPLRWSALFVLVNAGAAATLVMDRYGAPLDEEHESLYQEHFSQFSRGEFHQLLQLARHEEIPPHTLLTREGEVCEDIFFLQTGKAQVFHNRRFAAYIEQGGFVNDVAFQQGDGPVGAYGTVRTTDGPCQALVWNKAELQKHLKSRPSMNRNMKYTLSNHLMKSLLQQRDARRSNVNETEMNIPFADDDGGDDNNTGVLCYFPKTEA